jgi:hypothetical protein
MTSTPTPFPRPDVINPRIMSYLRGFESSVALRVSACSNRQAGRLQKRHDDMRVRVMCEMKWDQEQELIDIADSYEFVYGMKWNDFSFVPDSGN